MFGRNQGAEFSKSMTDLEVFIKAVRYKKNCYGDSKSLTDDLLNANRQEQITIYIFKSFSHVVRFFTMITSW